MNRRELLKGLLALPLLALPLPKLDKFAGLDTIGPCYPWKPGDEVADVHLVPEQHRVFIQKLCEQPCMISRDIPWKVYRYAQGGTVDMEIIA